MIYKKSLTKILLPYNLAVKIKNSNKKPTNYSKPTRTHQNKKKKSSTSKMMTTNSPMTIKKRQKMKNQRKCIQLKNFSIWQTRQSCSTWFARKIKDKCSATPNHLSSRNQSILCGPRARADSEETTFLSAQFVGRLELWSCKLCRSCSLFARHSKW